MFRNVSDRGGVQIHKNGGNYVTVENCYFEDCKTAITTDDYFSDVNTGIGFTANQNTCLRILNCQVRANTLLGSKGIQIRKAYSSVLISDCHVYVNDKPLEIIGGLVTGSTFMMEQVTVKNCYFRGSTVDLIGAERANFNENLFWLEASEIVFSSVRSSFSNNTLLGYGVKVQSTAKNNAVEGTLTVFIPNQCTFSENKFITLGTGSGISFFVSNAAFAELFFKNNIYFSHGSAFDFTGAAVTSGIKIEDGFRQGIRTVTTGGRTTNGNLLGNMSYDSTLKKPIWWDGTNWKDAAGNIV